MQSKINEERLEAAKLARRRAVEAEREAHRTHLRKCQALQVLPRLFLEKLPRNVKLSKTLRLRKTLKPEKTRRARAAQVVWLWVRSLAPKSTIVYQMGF